VKRTTETAQCEANHEFKLDESTSTEFKGWQCLYSGVRSRDLAPRQLVWLPNIASAI
jgi:hypothetical protein